jgi:hypothetical protein
MLGDTDNLIKTAAVTTAAYATGGTIPALAVAATAVGADAILPEEDSISEIEAGNQEQLTAYLFSNITETILYGVIGFLAFTTIIGPWAAQRRAKRKMKDEYHRKKYDDMKAELKVRRNKDGTD